MLSNVSIKQYLDSGDIQISPWEDVMMRAAGVTLHLGYPIYVPQKDIVVDPKNNVGPTYEKVVMTEEEPFLLESKMFVLAETYEEVGISEKIGMFMEGRSTISRLGISAVQASSIVDSGDFPRTKTLEIYNAGPNAVLLYPKMRFIRACFFLLNPAATIRYDKKGRYTSGDTNIPIFREEIKEE